MVRAIIPIYVGNQFKYLREGKVIFSYAFVYRAENRSVPRKQRPSNRVIVHHKGGDNFQIIWQERRNVDNTELCSPQDEANWVSGILETHNSKELIDVFDEGLGKYLIQHKIGQHDNFLNRYKYELPTLPFQIRQALLHHGFEIESLEVLPASW